MSAKKPRTPIEAELLITPDPQVRSEVFLFARDVKKSGMAIYFSRDGGKTFTAMIPAPSPSDRPGSVLMLNEDGSASWRLPALKGGVISSSGNKLAFVPFNLVGSLETGTTFGYFKVPEGKTAILYEIHVCMQDAADQTVSVDVINASGEVQGKVATISASSLHSTLVLSSPLKMIEQSIWSMKILGCGTSSAPGQNLMVTAGIEYQS